MRDGEFELVTLKSGARAVRHLGHGEVMHPAGGPWAEANRLYVDQPDLPARLRRSGNQPVCIFDIGLGAATNAVAALACARATGGQLELHSFERDLAPLRLALADAEGFPFLIPWREAAQALMNTGKWSGAEGRWTLHRGELLDCLQPDRMADVQVAELVFFDPFSPQHNAELWTPEAFAAVRRCCQVDRHGSTLLTYSAATPTRVSLLLGGFYVGIGSSTGTKRETTTAATRPELLAAPLGARWLARWERSTARAPIGQTELTAECERLLRLHPQFAGL